MREQSLPLSGYTVLDLTLARAGPSAVRLLADWGADVVRIEAPMKPGTTASDLGGIRHGPDSQNLHRNKRGLTINLKSERGKSLFLEMAKKADVIVENFRKDVKFRLGIDYDSVKEVNPAIVYASISGFGQEGPYSERPGVDQITQGTSGLMSITGEPGKGPMRVGIAISDTSAGMFLGQGILLALLHRERTGEGQWVHTSLLESMLCKLDFQGARYTMTGEIPPQEGNNHPTNSPMGVFEAADGRINMAASSSKMFSAFCKAMNVPEMAEDPDYAHARKRIENRHQLQQRINEITSQHRTMELVERLNKVGVPCGPIYNVGEAFEDPQVKYLKMVKPAHHKTEGQLNLVRTPINLSLFPHSATFDRAGPELGEHTDEILIEMGYSTEQIEELHESGIV
jgi:crotonobetainyl-CoA:carnitine CoA-transferase CaiB-like acyl-CoA transferase